MSTSEVPQPGAEVVHPWHGTVGVEAVDLVQRAGALRVELRRSYVDDSRWHGVLGKHWRLNWEVLLSRAGDFALVDAPGGTTSFTQSAKPGELVSLSGETLVASGPTMKHTKPDKSIDTFDERGMLIERRDANGNVITLRHDAEGRLAEIVGADGRGVKFVCSPAGRISTATASDGATARYGFQADGAEDALPESGLGLRAYEYDEAGLLVAHVHAGMRSVSLKRDTSGRVTSRAWDDKTAETYVYDDARRAVKHTDVAGKITTVVWSADNRQMTVTDAGGGKVVTDFDPDGRVVAVTGPKGRAEFKHDTQGRLVSISNPTEAETRFEYEGDTSLLKRVTSPQGTQELSYDERGRLKSVDGMALSYDASGRISTLRGKDGVTRTYDRDSKGRLLFITDDRGNKETFSYDERGRKVSHQVNGSELTRWSYNEQGQMTAEARPDGGKTRVTYSPTGAMARVEDGGAALDLGARGEVVSQSDGEGRATRFVHHADGSLAKVIAPDGRSESYAYDAVGKISSVIDERGNATRWKRDAQGRIVEIADPREGSSVFKYDDKGRMVESTDGAGITKKFEWDENGRLARRRGPADEWVAYMYSPGGRASAAKHSSGLVEEFEQDGAGRLTHLVINGKEQLTRRYEDGGRKLVERLASGLETTFLSDENGRLIALSSDAGEKLSWVYDEARSSVTTTDSRGGETRMNFDKDTRAIQVTNPAGGVTRMAYNKAGDLTGVTVPGGDAAGVEYDKRGLPVVRRLPSGGAVALGYGDDGQLASITDPLGRKEQIEIDKPGRITRVIDASGGKTEYDYDGAGRLTEKRRADGVIVRIGYDANGFISSVDDGAFPVRYTRDAKGRVLHLEYPALARTLTFEYDATGRRVKLADSGGLQVRYGYDDSGNLVSVKSTPGGEVLIRYDKAGRVHGMTYPNGVTAARAYDGEGQLAGMAYRRPDDKVFGGWNHTYDALGNRATTNNLFGTVTTFSYDAASQLIEEKANGKTIARHTYGKGGNRMSTEDGAGNRSVWKTDAADQLVQAGDESFRYDERGNMIERSSPRGVTRYAFNSENQLASVTLPDGKTIRHGYAPTGERVWREDENGRVWFVTDGLNVIAETGADLKTTAAYPHMGGVDTPLLVVEGQRSWSVHGDVLGSVTHLTDEAGDLVAKQTYDAFGRFISREGKKLDRFAFTARERDAATGLYYFRARWYDPALGRFLSRDPEPGEIAEPLTLHPYLYVGNNPLTRLDPMGAKWNQAVWRSQRLADAARHFENIHLISPDGNIVRGEAHMDGRISVYPAAFPDGIRDGVPATGSSNVPIGTIAHEQHHNLGDRRRELLIQGRFGDRRDFRTYEPARQEQIWRAVRNSPGYEQLTEINARLAAARQMVMAGSSPQSPEVRQVIGEYRNMLDKHGDLVRANHPQRQLWDMQRVEANLQRIDAAVNRGEPSVPPSSSSSGGASSPNSKGGPSAGGGGDGGAARAAGLESSRSSSVAGTDSRPNPQLQPGTTTQNSRPGGAMSGNARAAMESGVRIAGASLSAATLAASLVCCLGNGYT